MRRASHCPLINTQLERPPDSSSPQLSHVVLTSPFPRLGHPGGHGPKMSARDGGKCPLFCYTVYLLFVDRTWPWDIADASEAPERGGCRQAFVRWLVNFHAPPTSRPCQVLVEALARISCCKVNIGSTPKSPE